MNQAAVVEPTTNTRVAARNPLARAWKAIVKHRWLYIMLAPGVIYFLLFRYLPLWNAQIAFKSFKPLLGVWESPFVGFKNFVTFFNSF